MQKLYYILMLFLVSAYSAEARNYIVCVGIADYPGSKSDLKVSSQDAVTIKTLYDKNGNSETNILTNNKATKANILNAIGEMFLKATSDDAIILFFSGHGVPGGFVCYDGLLKYEAITAVMKKSKARSKIVFADACYAGKARNNNKRSQKQSEENVMFFLSSRTKEQSQERRNWHNSLFTAFLERGLRGGADNNRDRTITARELFVFVSKGVAETSQQKQHPVMWGKFDDNMPLMVWKKK